MLKPDHYDFDELMDELWTVIKAKKVDRAKLRRSYAYAYDLGFSKGVMATCDMIFHTADNLKHDARLTHEALRPEEA